MKTNSNRSKVNGKRLISDLIQEFLRNNLFMKIKIFIEPKEEILAPTFTSKLIKTIIVNNGFLKEYKDLYHAKPKRMFLSLIRDEHNNLLYKHVENLNEPPIRLLPGKQYSTYIRLVLPREKSISIPKDYYSELDTPFGKLLITVYSMHTDSLLVNKEGSWDYRYLKLVFYSPTILTHKLEIPPWLRNPDKVREQHRLLPTPGLVAAHVINMISDFQAYELKRIMKLQYYTLRSFNIGVVETNYSLKPQTIIYGKYKDKMLKPRALTGWIIYKPFTEWHKKTMVTLLKIAEYTGLGRSRGIGFGETKLITIK